MIYQHGNLLDALSPDDAIVHGCNMQGVWGSGVAKMMKEAHPLAYEKYTKDLTYGNPYTFDLGSVSIFKYADGRTILSALTQENYGRDGSKYVSYDAIDTAFGAILQWAEKNDKKIHIPDMIGAGLGGGDYDVISSIIVANERKYLPPESWGVIVWRYEKA